MQHLPDLSMSRLAGHTLRPILGPKAARQSTSWRSYGQGWNQHLPDLSMSRLSGHTLRPIPGPKAAQQSTSWRSYVPGWNQHLHDLSMSRSAGHTHLQIPGSKAPTLSHNSVWSRASSPVQQGSLSTHGPPRTDSGIRQGETTSHSPHKSQHTHLQETSTFANVATGSQHDFHNCTFFGEEKHRKKSCKHGILLQCFVCYNMGHKSQFCSYYHKWRVDNERSPSTTNKDNKKDTVIMRWLVLSVIMYWIICPTASKLNTAMLIW